MFKWQLQETEESLTEVFQWCMARAEEMGFEKKDLKHQLQERMIKEEEKKEQKRYRGSLKNCPIFS